MQEIIEELAAVEARKADLEARLAAAREEAKAGIITQIRDLIAGAGYTSDEILPLVAPPEPIKPVRVFPVFALSSDRSKTYSRGVLPGWMKEAMASAGLDAGSADDRGKFRDQHMVRV